jgi:hypothetical protein
MPKEIQQYTDKGGLRSFDSVVFEMSHGSVVVDPGSIATVARGSIAVSVPGVTIGDIFIPEFQPAINDDLVFLGAKITADDTVTFYFYNPTGLAIDDVAQMWDYTWIDRT